MEEIKIMCSENEALYSPYHWKLISLLYDVTILMFMPCA
jgi:hypothetical protein